MNELRDFKEAIRAELSDLRSEIDTLRPLFEKVELAQPDAIELRAIAATLHAFYGGVERVFLLIAKSIDLKIPSSGQWHRDLLDQMHSNTRSRRAVIDQTLHQRLSDYLGFATSFGTVIRCS